MVGGITHKNVNSAVRLVLAVGGTYLVTKFGIDPKVSGWALIGLIGPISSFVWSQIEHYTPVLIDDAEKDQPEDAGDDAQ